MFGAVYTVPSCDGVQSKLMQLSKLRQCVLPSFDGVFDAVYKIPSFDDVFDTVYTVL